MKVSIINSGIFSALLLLASQGFAGECSNELQASQKKTSNFVSAVKCVEDKPKLPGEKGEKGEKGDPGNDGKALSFSKSPTKYKEVNSNHCDTKEVFLGSEKEYLIWALTKTVTYRHGCNKGNATCSVSLKNGAWTLKAEGASGQCNDVCGAARIVCGATGLRRP